MNGLADLQRIVEGHYDPQAFQELAAEIGQHGPCRNYAGASVNLLELLLDAQCYDALEAILKAAPLTAADVAHLQQYADHPQHLKVFQKALDDADYDRLTRIATLFPLPAFMAGVYNLSQALHPGQFVRPRAQERPLWTFPPLELAIDLSAQLDQQTLFRQHSEEFRHELEWVALHVLAADSTMTSPEGSAENAAAFLRHRSAGEHVTRDALTRVDRLAYQATKVQDQQEVALTYLERGGFTILPKGPGDDAELGDWWWYYPPNQMPNAAPSWTFRPWF